MPQQHEWVSFRAMTSDFYCAKRTDGVEMFYGRCDLCSDEAEQAGATRRGRSPGGSKDVPKTPYGCSVCLVYICKKCKESGKFDSYEHPGDCSGAQALQEMCD